MIRRQAETRLQKLALQFPIVSLTGPRQSGKTTLVRHVFSEHTYVSLENPDELDFATEDPKGFLGRFSQGVILDEVQRAPKLFSYLQELVDTDRKAGHWILTGSEDFLLNNHISQSLAGRTGICRLYPCGISELADQLEPQWTKQAVKGFYLEPQTPTFDAREWHRSYLQTYVERDVRNLLNIGDLTQFTRFLRLCARRSGQLIKYNSLAIDAGISQPTAKKWLSVLVASGLVFLLEPYYENFNKRIIKMPKLYWVDSGLLCYLLQIYSAEDLDMHPARGAIFESMIVAEHFKHKHHSGGFQELYFWRDHSGHEIDLLILEERKFKIKEIKAAQTVLSEHFKALKQMRTIINEKKEATFHLIYSGKENYCRQDMLVEGWKDSLK